MYQCIGAQVAVLNLYNIVNKRLPGWQDPPTRARIKAALLEYDCNKDSVLNQEACVSRLPVELAGLGGLARPRPRSVTKQWFSNALIYGSLMLAGVL